MDGEYNTPENGWLRRTVLQRGALATAVAGLGIGGVAGTAAAKKNDPKGAKSPTDAIPIDGPTNITESGYYVLTRDIVGEGGISVEPGVNDVTIDGNGYTLDGRGQYSWGIVVGEYPGGPNTLNTTITNLSVTGFTIAGIELEEVRGGTIENVVVTENPNWGLSFLNSNDVTVERCTLSHNDSGTYGTEGSRRNVFLRNRITANRVGLAFDDACQYLVFEQNRFENNDDIGLAVGAFSDGAQIIKNLFYGNGVGLTGGLDHSEPDIIRGNRFIENTGTAISWDQSFVFQGDGPTRIESNKIFRNGGDGINLLVVEDFEVTKNVVRDNVGDGIELQRCEDGVVRRNVVKRNGGEPISVDADSTNVVVEDNRT